MIRNPTLQANKGLLGLYTALMDVETLDQAASWTAAFTSWEGSGSFFSNTAPTLRRQWTGLLISARLSSGGTPISGPAGCGSPSRSSCAMTNYSSG